MNIDKSKLIVLLTIDGLDESINDKSNAFLHANHPNIDKYLSEYQFSFINSNIKDGKNIPESNYFRIGTGNDININTTNNNCLTKSIAELDVAQLKISGIEKYVNLTYYFNGCNEKSYNKEDKLLLTNEDSGKILDNGSEVTKITNALIKNIRTNKYKFIFANLGNIDVLANNTESNTFMLIVKYIELIDRNLKKIVDSVLHKNGIIIITSAYGIIGRNKEDCDLDFKYTNKQVPLFIINKDKEIKKISSNKEINKMILSLIKNEQ